MFKVAICDDSRAGISDLVMWIRELADEISLEATVEVFRSYKTLLKAMSEQEYKLLILETSMGDSSGIEFARRLRRGGFRAEIIFYTKDPEAALEAYSAYPSAYVLKPASKKKFREPFRYVTEKYRKKPSVVLKTREGERVSVSVENICYVEVFRTELDVHCVDGVEVYVGSLSEVLRQLPQAQFYRSHRSFIVNLEFVSRIGKYFFTMLNGDKVAIAKNRYAEAKAKFEDFVGSV
ncbi:MAG: response regulator transcription factor [Clostridia bacterium]|nr:response regulator transcription factor [Clostridia bacterium]